MRMQPAPLYALAALAAALVATAAEASTAAHSASGASPAAAAASAGARAAVAGSSQLISGAARLCTLYSLLCAVSSCWVFFVAARLRPGLARGLACAPVVALLLAATPWLVDRRRAAVLIVPVTGMLSLSAFKVAAFALGRGPLALQLPCLRRLPPFAAIMCMPIIPQAAFKISQGSSAGALGSRAPASAAEFAASYACRAGAATLAAAAAVSPALPVLLRHWFYALCLSLVLGALWDFWSLVALQAVGIQAAPSFDRPWLSTSFADYWARRWNLTVTYLLRVLVYEPVMEGRLTAAAAAAPAANQHSVVKVPAAAGAATLAASCATRAAAAHGNEPMVAHITAAPAGDGDEPSSAGGVMPSPPAASRVVRQRRRLAALHASFAFSGAWHALIFYYATGLVTPHWFLFFFLQAPIVAAEAALLRAWRTAALPPLPRPAGVLLTNFLLIVVANPLLFGPCDWSGMSAAVFDSVFAAVSSAAR